MRKIETQMIAALRAGRAWQSGNTSVTAPDRTGRAQVHLHGNHIADVREGRAVPNLGTLANWPTATTKSRLRALGVPIEQRRGCIYINGALFIT
jgi:hypothetical protein